MCIYFNFEQLHNTMEHKHLIKLLFELRLLSLSKLTFDRSPSSIVTQYGYEKKLL
jgi:hypothetical protein